MKSDPEVFSAFQLAENLHMTVAQVMQMSEVERLGWSEFYREREERRKK